MTISVPTEKGKKMVDTLKLLGRVAIFDPFLDDKGKELTTTERGVIDYVNLKHSWFSVKYGKLRTSFKFSEIGTKVKVL